MNKIVKIIGLLMVCGCATFADIAVTTDSTSVFEGSFTFDIINDAIGLIKSPNIFPHLSFDGADNGQFQVNVLSGGNIELKAYDFGFGVDQGVEVYTPGSVEALRSGTFVSLFDNSDIKYEFSNVDTTSAIITGNFKYSVIPEPATVGLISVFGFGLLIIKRTFSI